MKKDTKCVIFGGRHYQVSLECFGQIKTHKRAGKEEAEARFLALNAHHYLSHDDKLAYEVRKKREAQMKEAGQSHE